MSDNLQTLKKVCELYNQTYLSHGAEDGAGANGWEYPWDSYHIYWDDNALPSCQTSHPSQPCLYPIPSPPRWYLLRADTFVPKGHSTESVTCVEKEKVVYNSSIASNGIMCTDDTINL